MHDSAVASLSPRARSSSSTSSAVPVSSREKRCAAGVLHQQRLELVARAPPRRAATIRSTWISKSRAQIVTSTPSPSPPAAASDSRDGRLRDAIQAEHPPLGGVRPLEQARSAARVSSTRGQSCCSSRGGPGSATATHAGVSARRRARSRRARPRARPRAASPASSRPSAKSVYGRRSRSATGARALDPASQPLSTTSGTPGRTGQELDRAVVVRRAETTRDTEQVVPRALRAARVSRSAGVVSDDGYPGGSIPSRNSDAARYGPFRSLRSPRTSSEPDATIAPSGAAQAGCQPVAVTMITCGSAPARARGAADLDPEVLGRVDRDPVAGCRGSRPRRRPADRAVEGDLAGGGAAVRDHVGRSPQAP